MDEVTCYNFSNIFRDTCKRTLWKIGMESLTALALTVRDLLLEQGRASMIEVFVFLGISFLTVS